VGAVVVAVVGARAFGCNSSQTTAQNMKAITNHQMTLMRRFFLGGGAGGSYGFTGAAYTPEVSS
jgi:hypothetical protein